MTTAKPIRVLYIPVDPSAPAVVGWISHYSKYDGPLAGLVEGMATVLQYDDDALIFINDSSQINGMDVNPRVTSYVFVSSEAARAGRTQECHPGTESVRGPVVMLGAALADVPQRLVDHFGAHEVS